MARSTGLSRNFQARLAVLKQRRLGAGSLRPSPLDQGDQHQPYDRRAFFPLDFVFIQEGRCAASFLGEITEAVSILLRLKNFKKVFANAWPEVTTTAHHWQRANPHQVSRVTLSDPGHHLPLVLPEFHDPVDRPACVDFFHIQLKTVVLTVLVATPFDKVLKAKSF
jgi:hypothetical protein